MRLRITVAGWLPVGRHVLRIRAMPARRRLPSRYPNRWSIVVHLTRTRLANLGLECKGLITTARRALSEVLRSEATRLICDELSFRRSLSGGPVRSKALAMRFLLRWGLQPHRRVPRTLRTFT
jgi:hypothetical protein